MCFFTVAIHVSPKASTGLTEMPAGQGKLPYDPIPPEKMGVGQSPTGFASKKILWRNISKWVLNQAGRYDINIMSNAVYVET